MLKLSSPLQLYVTCCIGYVDGGKVSEHGSSEDINQVEDIYQRSDSQNSLSDDQKQILIDVDDSVEDELASRGKEQYVQIRPPEVGSSVYCLYLHKQ